MKILVTGGAGFIASNFIHYWLDRHPDDSIVNLDKLTYAGNLENLSDKEQVKQYTFVKGDICDRSLVFDLVKEVDAIIHFAAETHVDRSIMDANPFILTNVLGTQTLLDAAVAAGKKRFHHVSTDEVFGSLEPEDPPFSEQTPYHPRNPYSATKAAADHLVRACFYSHGLPITISNCSNNYGPYMFPEKFMPLFISNLMEGKKVPIYGDGKQMRDWIYVEDHCSGIEAAFLHGRIGETYCFGGGGDITNLEVVHTLLHLLDRDESFIEYVKDRPGHDRRYAIDFSKAKQEFGWEPKWTLEEGLKTMVAWYKEHPEWVARCRDGSYQEYYKQQYVTR